MIEYGAYPSFMLTNADNYALHDTPLEDYFSLEYTSWKSVAADIYSKINSALKHTEGQSITCLLYTSYCGYVFKRGRGCYAFRL